MGLLGNPLVVRELVIFRGAVGGPGSEIVMFSTEAQPSGSDSSVSKGEGFAMSQGQNHA